MASNDSHPYDFQRQIPDEGFLFVEDGAAKRRKKGRWLVPPPTGALRTTRRDIRTNLFLQFSQLGSSESEILAFANREGFLSPEDYKQLEDVIDGDEKVIYEVTVGESIELWRKEICDLRSALLLWAAVKGRKTNKLKEWIKVHEPDYDNPREFPEHVHTRKSEEGDSVPQAVIFYLGERIVAQSEIHELALDWNDPALSNWPKLGRTVLRSIAASKLKASTQVVVVHESYKLAPKIAVRSLLARIWLQFLDSISSGRLKVCTFCRSLFYAEGRSDQTICSRACRQRSYEIGKAKAKRKGGKRGKKTSER